MMRLPVSRRSTRGTFLVAGTVIALLTMSAPAMAGPDAPFVWNGNGISSLSADRAVEDAVEDVETMAAGEGFFTCTLHDEPQVWEVFDDPELGHDWRASVNMLCT